MEPAHSRLQKNCSIYWQIASDNADQATLIFTSGGDVFNDKW